LIPCGLAAAAHRQAEYETNAEADSDSGKRVTLVSYSAWPWAAAVKPQGIKHLLPAAAQPGYNLYVN